MRSIATIEPSETIREQDPLKQGLKLRSSSETTHLIPIREQDPLKQGLKLDHLPASIRDTIREQDPLKQGLITVFR